jgi:O-succinylbenzoate synthase
MPSHDLQSDDLLHLEWTRYHRKLDPPLRTGQTVFAERTGLLLRVTPSDGARKSFFGEIAPLPFMGSESTEDAEAFLRGLPQVLPYEAYLSAARRAGPATAFGLRSCLRSIPASPPSARSAALLELDETAPAKLVKAREEGFRTFKLKCGFQDIASELANWESLLKVLRDGDRLRLDPNRAWRKEDWRRWKDHLRDGPAAVEFIEEPFPSGSVDAREFMAEAHASPVPLALDESLSEPGSLFRNPDFLGEWPGWFVIKPFLLGCSEEEPLGIAPSLSGKAVFSSVFETGIGLSRLIHLAEQFAPGIDHGLDTGTYFNDTLGLKASGSRLRALTAEEEAKLWTTLSASWKRP